MLRRFLDSAALHVFFELTRQRGQTEVAFVVSPEAYVASTLAIVGLPEVATILPSALPQPAND